MVDGLSSAPQAHRGHCRGSSAFMRVEVDLSHCMPAARLSTVSQHSCQRGSPQPGGSTQPWAAGSCSRQRVLPRETNTQTPPSSVCLHTVFSSLLDGEGKLGRSRWTPKRAEYQQDAIKVAGFPTDMPGFVFSHKTLSFGLTPEICAH